MAAAAKISYDTFNKVMEHKATFSVEMLSAIAEALSININWLVYGKEALQRDIKVSKEDDFIYTLYSDVEKLTPANKQRLLDMAHILLAAQQGEKA